MAVNKWLYLLMREDEVMALQLLDGVRVPAAFYRRQDAEKYRKQGLAQGSEDVTITRIRPIVRAEAK